MITDRSAEPHDSVSRLAGWSGQQKAYFLVIWKTLAGAATQYQQTTNSATHVRRAPAV